MTKNKNKNMNNQNRSYNNFNQKQGQSQNNFDNHTNNQQQPKKQGFVARKKAQWDRFIYKIKTIWEKAKKIAGKTLRIIMVVHIIVTAVITTTVFLNPLNHWHAFSNPKEMEILRNAEPETRNEMVESYKRVNQRTEEEKKKEIQKQFNKVSGVEDTVETKESFNLIKKAHASDGNTVVRTMTAYNLAEAQTDGAPCIGAANQNICFLMREKGMNVCASNAYSFGTILKIPGYLGHENNGDNTCVILDRKGPNHPNSLDICMDQNLTRAKKFGVQTIPVTVIGHMEGWSKLAPAKEFQEPSR